MSTSLLQQVNTQQTRGILPMLFQCWDQNLHNNMESNLFCFVMHKTYGTAMMNHGLPL